MRCQVISIKMTIIKIKNLSKLKIVSVGKDVEKLEHLYTVCGNIKYKMKIEWWNTKLRKIVWQQEIQPVHPKGDQS